MQPTGKHANFCDEQCPGKDPDLTQDAGSTTTSPVGFYSAGASKWGLLDMVGNVESAYLSRRT